MNKLKFTSLESYDRWFIHFCKTTKDADQIFATKQIKPDKDGISWAVKIGTTYPRNQIETDFDTGDQVARETAILFARQFNQLPHVFSDGTSAWDGPIDIDLAIEIDLNQAIRLCTTKEDFISSYSRIYEE